MNLITWTFLLTPVVFTNPQANAAATLLDQLEAKFIALPMWHIEAEVVQQAGSSTITQTKRNFGRRTDKGLDQRIEIDISMKTVDRTIDSRMIIVSTPEFSWRASVRTDQEHVVIGVPAPLDSPYSPLRQLLKYGSINLVEHTGKGADRQVVLLIEGEKKKVKLKYWVREKDGVVLKWHRMKETDEIVGRYEVKSLKDKFEVKADTFVYKPGPNAHVKDTRPSTPAKAPKLSSE
jgi:outer membrane lipoprotein-sorting protein